MREGAQSVEPVRSCRELWRHLHSIKCLSMKALVFDSKSTVNSMMQCEEVFLVSNARSGIRESPVLKLGDKNEERSAYIEQLDKDEKVLV